MTNASLLGKARRCCDLLRSRLPRSLQGRHARRLDPAGCAPATPLLRPRGRPPTPADAARVRRPGPLLAWLPCAPSALACSTPRSRAKRRELLPAQSPAPAAGLAWPLSFLRTTKSNNEESEKFSVWNDHYYKTGICSRPFVPTAFGPGTIGGFCPRSNG